MEDRECHTVGAGPMPRGENIKTKLKFLTKAIFHGKSNSTCLVAFYVYLQPHSSPLGILTLLAKLIMQNKKNKTSNFNMWDFMTF